MLWYSGANYLKPRFGIDTFYQIGLAFSADGKRFTRVPVAESPYARAGLVFMGQNAFPGVPDAREGVLADPEVVLKDGVFHMWFSAVIFSATGEGIGGGISYATSSDGSHWTPSRKNPLRSLIRDNPPTAGFQPSVLWNQAKGRFEMWFSNDRKDELEPVPAKEHTVLGYRYASSTNGEDWTNFFQQGRDFSWDKNSPFEELGLITGVGVGSRTGSTGCSTTHLARRRFHPDGTSC